MTVSAYKGRKIAMEILRFHGVSSLTLPVEVAVDASKLVLEFWVLQDSSIIAVRQDVGIDTEDGDGFCFLKEKYRSIHHLRRGQVMLLCDGETCFARAIARRRLCKASRAVIL